MPWGAAAAAGIGLVGSALQSSAVSKGASAAAGAQQRAAAIQRNDLMPFASQGVGAVDRAANLIGLGGEEAGQVALDQFRTSPGYEFQMKEGLRAVDAGASAKGLLRSGATLKAEQEFGAGLADSDFGTYYNRLFGLAQLGENAAAGQGAGAIATGQGIADTQASAAGSQASIYGDATKSLGSAVGGLLSNPEVQNRLFGPSTVGNAYTPSIYGVPSPY